jgi:hypothetical protein
VVEVVLIVFSASIVTEIVVFAVVEAALSVLLVTDATDKVVVAPVSGAKGSSATLSPSPPKVVLVVTAGTVVVVDEELPLVLTVVVVLSPEKEAVLLVGAGCLSQPAIMTNIITIPAKMKSRTFLEIITFTLLSHLFINKIPGRHSGYRGFIY